MPSMSTTSKVYVYTSDSGREILLHQASYLAPVAGPERAGALNGTNHVYAPGLERELQYGCNLLKGTPRGTWPLRQRAGSTGRVAVE
jgi:hypothetical protein